MLSFVVVSICNFCALFGSFLYGGVFSDNYLSLNLDLFVCAVSFVCVCVCVWGPQWSESEETHQCACWLYHGWRPLSGILKKHITYRALQLFCPVNKKVVANTHKQLPLYHWDKPSLKYADILLEFLYNKRLNCLIFDIHLLCLMLVRYCKYYTWLV